MKSLAGVGAELLRDRPLQFPSVLAKTIVGYAKWRIWPGAFFARGLQYRPLGTGRDYMRTALELFPGLDLLNCRGEGRRLAEDKVATAERLVSAGIATPPILAVVGRDLDSHPRIGAFRYANSIAEVTQVLADAPDLLIAKPAGGARGEAIQGPERTAGGWTMGGASLSPEDLAKRLLDSASGPGLLLQPRLRSHASMAPLGGELGLCSIRIATALTTDGPEIVFTWLKIMGSKGLVDNFARGAAGNLIAGVDERGEIFRAYGRKPGRTYLLVEATHHPVTGTPLIGCKLPLWEEAVAAAKRAALAFPENPLIGQDVALEENGPMIIETNWNWDTYFPELFLERGLRPMLRGIVPRLAVDEAVRAEAARRMRL